MTELLIQSIGNVFSLQTLIFINLGIMIGIIFGTIPGLTGNLGIILLLPMTSTMSLPNAIIFLTSIFCGGEFGGSISAILIGTPGTNSATCTMIEGYPLAKQGHARKALMMALIASTIGGVLSALSLLIFAPTIAKYTLEFGPPEYFAMAVFGLSIIASLSGKSLEKGIVAGCIGIMLSLVGMDIASGTQRFTFHNVNLLRGLTLLPLLTGLFAVPNIVEKIRTQREESGANIIGMDKTDKLTAGELKGLRGVIAKSSVIGIIIGAIPGAGTGIASFISYNEAKRSSKEPEKFGTGTLEGIAASESANNAVTAASLIPLLTLGIPGSPSAAALIGAFTLQGVALGPMLFKENGVIMYTIMIGLVVANLFMFLQGKLFSGLCARISNIPDAVMIPVLITLCTAGAYSVNNSSFDVMVFMIFGIAAYVLSLAKIPLVPVVLGFVLGPLLDFNLRRGLIMSQGSWLIFVKRPISLVILLLTALVLIFAVIKGDSKKRTTIIEKGNDD